MPQIKINNFGPIAHAEIELKKITVLIGEQASGKSTIAKVIYFFKSLKEEFYKSIRYEHNEKVLEKILIKSIQDNFAKFFGSSKFYDPDFSIKYYYSETTWLLITRTDTLQIKFSNENNVNYLTRIIDKLHPIYQNILRNQPDFKLLEIYARQLREVLDTLFIDTKNPLYIPASRNISVSYPEFFQKVFFSELSSSIESLSTNQQFKGVDLYLMRDFITYVDTELRGINFDNDEEMLRIIKLKYKLDNGVEKLVLSRPGRYVRLDQSSTGQQEVIRLLQDAYVVRQNNKAVFRVIEEPEAHLFPKAQQQLLIILTKTINQTASELLITTHSPYLLMILNNLMYSFEIKGPDNSRLNPAECNVYQLELAKENELFFNAKLINEAGLIGQNYLDKVSEELGAEFDKLYEIEAESLEN